MNDVREVIKDLFDNGRNICIKEHKIKEEDATEQKSRDFRSVIYH